MTDPRYHTTNADDWRLGRQAEAEKLADELKGKELDAALKAAGLSTAGTADEKRARLAEAQAGGDTPGSDSGNSDDQQPPTV